jgi:hypothetical protein
VKLVTRPPASADPLGGRRRDCAPTPARRSATWRAPQVRSPVRDGGLEDGRHRGRGRDRIGARDLEQARLDWAIASDPSTIDGDTGEADGGLRRTCAHGPKPARQGRRRTWRPARNGGPFGPRAADGSRRVRRPRHAQVQRPDAADRIGDGQHERVQCGCDGQLSASPSPKSTPPMATTMPGSGCPRMIEATAIVSGIDRACDDRGRIPLRAGETAEGISTIQPGSTPSAVSATTTPAPFGTARSRRCRADRRCASGLRRQRVGEPSDGDHGRAIVPRSVPRMRGPPRAWVASTSTPRAVRTMSVGDDRFDIDHGSHDTSSTRTSRKCVAQLMHGS